MKPRLLLAWQRLLLASLFLLFAACDSGGETLPQIGAFDEWVTDTPASQNLDTEPLSRMTVALHAGDYGEVHSLLIARNGVLVYERYFRDATRDGLHQVYSVTKSVTSSLIGIAIAEGHIGGVETPLLDFFPEYELFVNANPQKARMTLEHVLNMQTGLQWNEWSTPYNDPNNPTANLSRSDDWIKFMLDLPMDTEPGTVFTYNSGATMLLAGILKNTTGRTAEEYAREKLFEPLGIERYSWREGPNDITNTGWGLFLTPRDMARFGHLFLLKGQWGDRSIVPPSWVDVLAEPVSTFGDGTGYTYQWWLMPMPDGSHVPYADGYGGQFIFVIPSLDMVVVSTATNFTSSTNIRALLNEFIFPAVD